MRSALRTHSGMTELASRHPLQDESRAAVVGIDGTYLLGHGTCQLKIAGRQGALCSIE